MEDWMVLLTGGMEPHNARRNGWKLNYNSHMRAAATGHLYHQGKAGRVLISGGKTKGEDNPSLSHIMADEVHRRYKVPLESIVIEEASMDTTENAEFSTNYLRRRGVEDISLVTIGYHIDRAAKLFEMYGMNVEPFAAEEVIKDISPRHAKLAEELRNNPEFEKKKREQARYSLLDKYFEGQMLLRAVTQILRG